jgi:hypothetical protein
MAPHRIDPMARLGSGRDPVVRFWENVAIDGRCWIWVKGLRDKRKGYGVHYIASHRTAAHRYAWELLNGPIPGGLDVLHRCDNPRCVRPDHLFIGTHRDNMADMVAKRRHGARHRDLCRNGHPLHGDNVVIRADGQRRCRLCRNASERMRKYRRGDRVPGRGPGGRMFG